MVIQKPKLLFPLIFLAYLTGLSSSQFHFLGVPFTFIFPAFFSILLMFLFPLFNKKLFNFAGLFFFVLIVLTIFKLLLTTNQFSFKSFFLFLISFSIFIISSNSVYLFFKSKNLKLIQSQSILWLCILLLLCIADILFNDFFISIRSYIYPPEALNENAWRDARNFLGISRPLLLFNEPSHLAKLFGFFWVLYAVSSNFNLWSLLIFATLFFVLRSPTLFLVFPLFIFYLYSPLFVTLRRKLLLFLSGTVAIVVCYFTLWNRINIALINGEGSLSERYLYPAEFIFNNFYFLSIYPLGGHQSLYNYVCESMAATRPWLTCSTDSSVAASSALVLFGAVGLIGFLFLLILMIWRFKLWGAFYIVVFFGVQFFLTGYNTPSNYIITALLLSSSFYYVENKIFKERSLS